MAESLFSASLLDELERDHRHMSDISDTVQDLSRRLKAEVIPFALVGGLSLRHYGFVRHTEDIDILTSPTGLELIHKKFVGLGYALRAAGLRKSLRNTRFKVNVVFIQSGEHAGSASSPYVYPDPRSDAFTDDPSGLRIPKLSTLLVIKLVSGLWGRRLKDLADVQELIKANKLDESFSTALIPEVQEKYRELLEMTQDEVDPETGLS